MSVAACLIFALVFSCTPGGRTFARWGIFAPALLLFGAIFGGLDFAQGLAWLMGLVLALKGLKAWLDARDSPTADDGR